MPPNQQPQQTEQPRRGSNISNFHWGMLIGAALMIDLFQLLLDAMGVGLILNEGFDIVIGAAFIGYFKWQGVSTNSKQLFNWALWPFVELLTASIFPIGWVLEVVMTMVWDKMDKKLG